MLHGFKLYTKSNISFCYEHQLMSGIQYEIYMYDYHLHDHYLLICRDLLSFTMLLMH